MTNHAHLPAQRRRRPGRALATIAAAAALALLPAFPADAHVRATADNPSSGGFSAVTFRVPNESDTAGTVKLSVELPTQTPFVYVSTKPVPGWTVTAPKKKLPTPYDLDGTSITEAVQTVTWTADKGTQIAPGEYQEFSISVGPLPEPGTVLLPATQTYSDGTVVAWDQPTPSSGEEPEHPAPAIEVVAAAAGSGSHGQAEPSAAASAEPSAQPGSAASTGSAATDPVARVLGGLGLVAGLAAAAVAVVALRRRSA